jgi:plasmid maintenance system antidote protein VapI
MEKPSTKAHAVESAMSLGFSFSAAVQAVVGCTVTALAEEFEVPQPSLSMCLNAYEGRVYPELRDKLARKLGTTREQVDAWLERAGRTTSVT